MFHTNLPGETLIFFYYPRLVYLNPRGQLYIGIPNAELDQDRRKKP